MTRVKRGSVGQKRHRKIVATMQGAQGAHSRLTRTAQQQVLKKLVYSRRDRRLRKRNLRSLWITRINAAARVHLLSYSRMMDTLYSAEIRLNRKMLSQMAVWDSASFNAVLQSAKIALASSPHQGVE
jgi:large subunit ribosomal protein L20